MEKPDEDNRSYAIELLDSSLEAVHKKIITPLFTRVYLTEAETKEIKTEDFLKVIEDHLIPHENDNIHILTTLASIYIIFEEGLDELKGKLVDLKNYPSPLIQETLQWKQ